MTEAQAEAQEAEAQEAEAEDADDDDGDASVEQFARSLGWRPKDEFHGDPTLWRPAKEWSAKGKDLAPFLENQRKEFRKELAEVKAEHSAEIKRIGSMNERALRVQRESIERDYDVAKRKAVEMGDSKAYDAAERDEKKALKQFDDEAAKTAEAPKQGEFSESEMATVQTFWQANARIASSPLLRGAADEIWGEVNAEEPDMALKDKLATVKQRVVEQFPDRFPDQARKTNGAARVEGGGGRSPDGGDEAGGKLWSQVPKEYRQAALHQIEVERLFDPPGVKQGEDLTPAQKKQAKERYAELYLQG